MTLVISIIVIFLCLLLLYNNFSVNKNALYICSSLIFMCLIGMLHHFTIIEPNRFWMAVLMGHIIPLTYLIGPFLYFYTRNTLTASFQLRKWDYLHFLPFAISLISLLPYFLTDFDTKLRLAQSLIDQPAAILKINISFLYPNYINIMLRPIGLLFYSIVCLLLVFQFIKTNKSANPNKKILSIPINWLIVVNFILVLMAIGYSQLTIHFFNTANDTITRANINQSKSPISYILSLCFGLVPVLMLLFPEILYGFEKFKKQPKPKIIPLKVEHEAMIGTAEAIVVYISKEENLRNLSFSVRDICKALEIKSQDVDYCFKMILKTKFITLKKELRVALAQKELSNVNLLSHSMEAIWMNAGFSSKTSFFVAFKEVTGTTPLEFLKS